jgi:hypothetical protein
MNNHLQIPAPVQQHNIPLLDKGFDSGAPEFFDFIPHLLDDDREFSERYIMQFTDELPQ